MLAGAGDVRAAEEGEALRALVLPLLPLQALLLEDEQRLLALLLAATGPGAIHQSALLSPDREDDKPCWKDTTASHDEFCRAQVRFRMLLYFFWVMGGVVHCGHLLILLCVGPRLHMETGRFLHRRILQVNLCP